MIAALCLLMAEHVIFMQARRSLPNVTQQRAQLGYITWYCRQDDA